jgi:hypothetical protein
LSRPARDPLQPQGAAAWIPTTTRRCAAADPYTVFQVSPITPIETQRLRLTVGAPPNTRSVTYVMDGQPLGTVTEAPWELWWTLELGQHELAATATLGDGSEQTSAPIPFRVTDYVPPEVRDLNPP